MLRIREVKIGINNNTDEHILSKVSKLLNTNVLSYKIIKKSIDARDKNNILFVYTLDVEVDNQDKVELTNKITITPDETYKITNVGNELLDHRPIVIGAGPSGLFCAYILAENGYKPIVFERGKDVDNRIKDVNEFIETNKLNINSNIQFGEGGAGTFSDGKLNTLISDKNCRMNKVFDIFVENGAPEEIKYDYHPHIGTDILRVVIKNIRNKIISMGGEFHFESTLTDIIIDNHKIKGIIINDADKYDTDALFLCIGHSARDTFKMLNKNNIYMEPKAFAVGVRVIHEQRIIDAILHHNNELLGPASYKVTHNTQNGRGVYSFCMCPGGYVINSSSEENKLVVNGMSNYRRDSGYANSAIVVTVDHNDYGDDLFDGMKFQEELERKTYELGNGAIPVQYYKDFVANKVSDNIETKGIMGKYVGSNLNEILPLFISDSIKEGMTAYSNRIRGFNDGKTILCGTETRTSSPIRIVRDSLDGSANIAGIYPCGEGAGYAGGITSAAVDGIKQAENLIKIYKNVK